jgi:hypothetical protein
LRRARAPPHTRLSGSPPSTLALRASGSGIRRSASASRSASFTMSCCAPVHYHRGSPYCLSRRLSSPLPHLRHISPVQAR